jgi:hypothetical protein
MLRENGSDWSADHFFGAITVEILGALVPSHDDAVEITAHDGFVGGSHDGSQLVAAFLGPGAGSVGADQWLPFFVRLKRALSVTIRSAV